MGRISPSLRRYFLWGLLSLYAIGLGLFVYKYVPLTGAYPLVFSPILVAALISTALNARMGTFVFIFLFPLINNLPYYFGLSEAPHAPAAIVLFLFYFGGWAIHRIRSERPRTLRQPIFWPILGLSSVIFISALFAFLRYTNFFPFQSNSLYEFVTNVQGVTSGGAIMSILFFSLNYLSGMAFFIILILTLDFKKDLKSAIFLLSLSAFFSFLFGLYQHFVNIRFGNWSINITQGLQNATFQDALAFGAFLSIMTPFFLGLIFTVARIQKIFFVLLAVLSAFLILYSGTKIGFVAMLMVSVILLFIFIFWRYKHFKSSLKASLDTGILRVITYSIILLAFLGIFLNRKFIVKEISNSQTLTRLRFDSGTIHRRISTLWTAAGLMIKDFPLTGIGIGGFIIESANYARHYNIALESESAENYFLQIASELGPLGILFSIWIGWEILKMMAKCYRKVLPHHNLRFLFAGIMGGILVYIINLQFHTYIGSFEIKYTCWLFVALIYGLTESLKPEQGAVRHSIPNPRLGLRRLFILALGLFAVFNYWTATHALSLRNTSIKYGISRDFGLGSEEKDLDGRVFRWTREYGALAIKIESALSAIPIHASHPDIAAHPVRLDIYVVRNYFGKIKFKKSISIVNNDWQTIVLDLGQDIGHEVLLLFKISRTWNPMKLKGIPDPRNLGVAVGKIENVISP